MVEQQDLAIGDGVYNCTQAWDLTRAWQAAELVQQCWHEPRKTTKGRLGVRRTEIFTDVAAAKLATHTLARSTDEQNARASAVARGSLTKQ